MLTTGSSGEQHMLLYNRVTPRQESWSSTATAPLRSQSCYHKLPRAYLHRYTNVTARDHLGPPAARSVSVSLVKHSTFHRDSPPYSARVSWLVCACSSTLGLDSYREIGKGTEILFLKFLHCNLLEARRMFKGIVTIASVFIFFVKQWLGQPFKIGWQAHLGVCFHLGKMRGIRCVLHKGHSPKTTWRNLYTVMDIL